MPLIFLRIVRLAFRVVDKWTKPNKPWHTTRQKWVCTKEGDILHNGDYMTSILTSTKFRRVFHRLGRARPPTWHCASIEKFSNRTSTVGSSMPTLLTSKSSHPFEHIQFSHEFSCTRWWTPLHIFASRRHNMSFPSVEASSVQAKDKHPSFPPSSVSCKLKIHSWSVEAFNLHAQDKQPSSP